MKTICINGIIGAGKTTFVKKYSEYLQSLGCTVITVYEAVQDWIDNGMLDLFYKDPVRWGYTFQTMVYESRITTINNAYTNYMAAHENKEPDYILLDRSPETDQLFMELLYEAKTVTSSEYGLYTKWKELWRTTLLVKPDIYVYINPSVEVCMDRLKSRGRKEETTIPKKYQTALATKHDIFLCSKEDVILVGDTYVLDTVHSKITLL